MDFLKEFIQYWQVQQFVSPKSNLLLAVSGGKDSMALANVMHQLEFNISIAHCNFQLRGEDSFQDETFVRDWAAQRNIPFYFVRFDTEHEMNVRKTGIQETARNLRYEWFEDLSKKHQFEAIATAHHANDNAETLIMNLSKTCGISGLHGIPSKNNKTIRPLLFANSKKIEAFIQQNDIKYREDVSNASTKYLRNKVRHNIIPEMEKVFPNLIDNLNSSMANIAAAEKIYKYGIESWLKKLLEKRGQDIYIPILKLKKIAGYESICFELGQMFGFSAAQSAAIHQLCESNSGHYTQSNSHKIIKNRDFLIITPQSERESNFILITNYDCNIETEEGLFKLKINDKDISILNDKNIAQIDFESIEQPLILRHWKKADYFYPLGMGMKKKKLSRFFIDQKVPLHLKEKIWVLESNKKIVWIGGFRIDERFKISNNTKKMLQIHFLQK